MRRTVVEKYFAVICNNYTRLEECYLLRCGRGVQSKVFNQAIQKSSLSGIKLLSGLGQITPLSTVDFRIFSLLTGPGRPLYAHGVAANGGYV